MEKMINFCFRITLKGYCFNPLRPEGLIFTDKINDIIFEVLPIEGTNDIGSRHVELYLRVKKFYKVTDLNFEIVESIINKKIVPPEHSPISLPYRTDERDLISEDGQISSGYSPTSDFLSVDLQELCISTGVELEKHAMRFVQLLRWLEHVQVPVTISEMDPRFGLYWKTTQDAYHTVPWPRQGPITIKNIRQGITWSVEDSENLTQLWAKVGMEEPLGHQLLREAKSIAHHNQRGALLICYSALEVGLKQHISNCVPKAGWFTMFSPSPPLIDILKKYLPMLHCDNLDFQRWNKLKPKWKTIESFVSDRNKLAHRGEKMSGVLDEYVCITEDLLTAFDVFEGHSWAKKHVSHEFGELLGWDSNRGRGTVILQLPQ
jgi:hypothetical protein